MTINIKYTDTDPDDALRAYTEEKVASFEKFLRDEDFEGAICDVEFRHDAHHQSGDVCYAEITLEAGGQVYRASKAEPTFEKAIDKLKDDVLQILRTEKEKREHNFMRGAAEAKEMMQQEGL